MFLRTPFGSTVYRSCRFPLNARVVSVHTPAQRSRTSSTPPALSCEDGVREGDLRLDVAGARAEQGLAMLVSHLAPADSAVASASHLSPAPGPGPTFARSLNLCLEARFPHTCGCALPLRPTRRWPWYTRKSRRDSTHVRRAGVLSASGLGMTCPQPGRAGCCG